MYTDTVDDGGVGFKENLAREIDQIKNKVFVDDTYTS